MMTVFKWMAAAVFTGLVWLVTGYTVEYLKPYKKIETRSRKN